MNEYTLTIEVTVESDLSEDETAQVFAEYGHVVTDNDDVVVTGWTVRES